MIESSQEPYTKENGGIYFYGNRIESEVTKADYETFEFLGGVSNDMSNKECKFDDYTGVYAKDKNHAFYNRGIIQDADVESFKYIDGYYAQDKNAVYYSGRRLEDADYNSLEIVNGGFWCQFLKDKQFVFYNETKLTNLDSKTVRIDFPYIIDKNGVYYVSEESPQDNIIFKKVLSADINTFVSFGDYYISKEDAYAEDKNNVYWNDEIIVGADPNSFSIFDNVSCDVFRAKDQHSVYVNGQQIKGSDGQTYKFLTCDYAKDAQNAYYRDDVILDAYSDTFQSLDGLYAKDKNNVYWAGKPIKDADPETFITCYRSKAQARDKNRFYNVSLVVDLLLDTECNQLN